MRMSFKEWMRELNKICLKNLSLGIRYLPDMLFRDAFEEGITPKEFFEEDVMEEVYPYMLGE